MTLSITTLIITTVRKITLSIISNNTQHDLRIKTISIVSLSRTTLNITKFSITTLDIVILSTAALSMNTLNIVILSNI